MPMPPSIYETYTDHILRLSGSASDPCRFIDKANPAGPDVRYGTGPGCLRHLLHDAIHGSTGFLARRHILADRHGIVTGMPCVGDNSYFPVPGNARFSIVYSASS